MHSLDKPGVEQRGRSFEWWGLAVIVEIGGVSKPGEFSSRGLPASEVVGPMPPAPTMLGTWTYGIWL